MVIIGAKKMSQTVASYADYTPNAVSTWTTVLSLALYFQCNFLLTEMANMIDLFI